MSGLKVALIIEEMDQSYQSEILKGISASAAEFSMDISVFVSFSGLINSGHEKGEFNIFNLPDFRDFDGAILLTNTLARQNVIDDIIKRIKAAGIPTVSIDNDLPELFHVGIDNKTAMRRITEHLIKVHRFTDLAYVTGPEGNPESADRLSAFLEVLDEHNIDIPKENIYNGNFRAPSGRAAAEYFLSRGGKLPQAVICANDVMAASMISRFAESGVKVPDDIAVTGFDNTYSSHNYQVEITTVDRPLSLSGRIACKMLHNYYAALDQERSVILNMSTRFTESCGCTHNVRCDVGEIKELNYRNYTRLEKTQSFMSDLNRLSVDLLAANSFEQYIDTLKKFAVHMDPEEFYFCLCDNWLSDIDLNDPMQALSEPSQVLTSYTDTILVPVAYADGKFIDVGSIDRKSIVPDAAPDKTGRMYYHVPLHFGSRCLGYMVIYFTKLPMHNSMFETFCITLSNSLENIRKLITLEKAVERLEKLYARDTFSGIYNRNGFVQATDQLYAECIAGGRDIMLMFIDLDGLKVINDTFGHGVGDKAICCIADALVASCVNGEVYCRFGGDEFIVFAADYTDSEAKALTKRIEDSIAAINASGENQFHLSASTGYVIAKPKAGEDIFNFVTDADNEMYKEKRKKKHSKYLKAESNTQDRT